MMFSTPAAGGTPADTFARPARTHRWRSIIFWVPLVFWLPRLGLAEEPSGSRIVALAQQLAQAHVPYRSGGTGKRGLDCSGLVWYVHQQIGVRVPRRAQEQFKAATPVKLTDLTPGDLLFFRMRNSRRIDHVGIYTGPGQLIHASTRRRSVTVARLDERYFVPRVVSAGRLWDCRAQAAATAPCPATAAAALRDRNVPLF